MKLLSSGILATIGFSLGILAPLQQPIGKIPTTHLKFSKTTESSKADEYWRKIVLNPAELEQYVNNIQCQKNNKKFLACVNAIQHTLQKTNYKLSIDGSIVEIVRSENKLDNLTEKQSLIGFINLREEGLARSFDFEKIWKQSILLIDEKDKSAAVASAINGYLSVAVDPHTYISPTDFFKNVSSNNERSKYFLGLSFEKRENKIFIKKIFKNSDADLAGLEADDEVLSVNGETLVGHSISDVSLMVKNTSQQIFPFLIKRNNLTYLKKINRTYRDRKSVV